MHIHLHALMVICICAGPAGIVAAPPTQAPKKHEPKLSYLDNGVIKLAVDLDLGGARLLK